MYWLWITALAAEAEGALGDCEAYARILEQASGLILKEGTIHEVYSLRGGSLDPVRRLIYRAEEPFTWSSAAFLQAVRGGCR